MERVRTRIGVHWLSVCMLLMVAFVLTMPKIAAAEEQEMDAYWKIDDSGALIIQPTASEGFEKIVIEESDSAVWRGWPWEKVRGFITSIRVKDGVMALEDSSKMFYNPYSCKHSTSQDLTLPTWLI